MFLPPAIPGDRSPRDDLWREFSSGPWTPMFPTPTGRTPVFSRFHPKPLDGHPTPATPFLRLSTGASGVGMAASVGLAFGAMDSYAKDAPGFHIVEGEGGMTPGRVGEAMAAAGTACLKNAILHVDWNQASIDSNRVCRDGQSPGEYGQWNPIEFALLQDWNAILVPDGMNFEQIIAAQRRALAMICSKFIPSGT